MKMDQESLLLHRQAHMMVVVKYLLIIRENIYLLSRKLIFRLVSKHRLMLLPMLVLLELLKDQLLKAL